MIPRSAIIFLLASSALTAAAPWNSTPKPVEGTYQIYGGGLGDMVPPTKKDRKVSLSFTGPFAKELFDQIGPDMKDACDASPTHSERQRGDLDCIRDGKEYMCYLGLNVLTGKSIGGSIC
jgi:hypothetical protein